MNALAIFVTAGFYSALVRMATPLIFGSLGELIGQRAGVMNLGIEGIMTVGALLCTIKISGLRYLAGRLSVRLSDCSIAFL
jgi:ABC-type uncharacterized transport system permease subunit